MTVDRFEELINETMSMLPTELKFKIVVVVDKGPLDQVGVMVQWSTMGRLFGCTCTIPAPELSDMDGRSGKRYARQIAFAAWKSVYDQSIKAAVSGKAVAR